MQVPDDLIETIIKISKSEGYTLKRVAIEAKVHRRTLDNVLYQKRAHLRIIERFAVAYPSLKERVDQIKLAHMSR